MVSKGIVFEAKVVAFLERQGYTILGRNRRIASIEIDILAKKEMGDEEHFYFVECKSSPTTGYPLMGRRQKERYLKAMATFQAERGEFLNVHLALAFPDELTGEVLFIPDYFA
ncbi:MAG: YraN family protein [Leptospiraceae bacterium]|nr:YraN family protein [Leptospiraceae bacterium]MDW8307426.1 YraN family protein [Leptospiraceae bacterium]